MKILFFGAGDLSAAFARRARLGILTYEVEELGKAQCDVRDFHDVIDRVDAHRPDFIVNTAGLSDRIIGTNIQEILDVNLKGAMYVAAAGRAFGTPVLLLGSTAGMQNPALHPVYGPAKAGVIAHVAAAGAAGQQIYCLSPNRMDTSMRENDWPEEDPKTRLDPMLDVVPVMIDIIEGRYPVGANVVVRKVGTSGRVDVFQAPTVSYEGML